MLWSIVRESNMLNVNSTCRRLATHDILKCIIQFRFTRRRVYVDSIHESLKDVCRLDFSSFFPGILPTPAAKKYCDELPEFHIDIIKCWKLVKVSKWSSLLERSIFTFCVSFWDLSYTWTRAKKHSSSSGLFRAPPTHAPKRKRETTCNDSVTSRPNWRVVARITSWIMAESNREWYVQYDAQFETPDRIWGWSIIMWYLNELKADVSLIQLPKTPW